MPLTRKEKILFGVAFFLYSLAVAKVVLQWVVYLGGY